LEEKSRMWYGGFLDRGYRELSPINYGYEYCESLHTGYGRRSYYMIHYVIRGTGKLYCENKEYTVDAGQIFIVLPYENAHYVADAQNPWEYVWISFEGTLAGKLDTLDSKVFDMPYEPFAMIRQLEKRQDTKEEIGASALFMIFAELFSGRSKHPHYVRRTVDSINSLYMSPITVESLARDVGLDRRYLTRIFKESVGESIQEYIIRVRMENAERHLKDGLSVAMTAELVGYNDPFNFSKMFKKYYGMSPSKYK
jgi:AraC-like DNA-binding protein